MWKPIGFIVLGAILLIAMSGFIIVASGGLSLLEAFVAMTGVAIFIVFFVTAVFLLGTGLSGLDDYFREKRLAKRRGE